MGIIELTLIAVGLSADAFAAAACAALADRGSGMKNSLVMAAYFGVFQALMPVIGYLAGSQFADSIAQYDHWVAFCLLAFIGGKMVYDSFNEKGEDKPVPPNFRNTLTLAFATSVDALAVGVSFSFLDVDILASSAFIGAVTFSLSLLGARAGKFFGMKHKAKATAIGGLMLVAIGVKIVLEHMLGSTGI
ncbi:MAG: manganese efflux pump MntP family protein [Oscillospiraceae bacterium]|jgi:putative Mn2+ efflux pump MntP|nr:manganese efflux pump MntP family protein [Oscillospiraceae bacterium]